MKNVTAENVSSSDSTRSVNEILTSIEKGLAATNYYSEWIEKFLLGEEVYGDLQPLRGETAGLVDRLRSIEDALNGLNKRLMNTNITLHTPFRARPY